MFKNSLSKVDNLLLNLCSGLEIVNLTDDETELLVEKFGNKWRSVLGYSEEKDICEGCDFENPSCNRCIGS